MAGCKHSVALTRVFFLAGIAQFCVDKPLAPPQIYVDDTAMITHGDHEVATHSMYNTIEDFVELSKQLGLKLSTEGVIIARRPSAAKVIIKELQKKGIRYNTNDNAKYLGIDCLLLPKTLNMENI